MGMLVNIKAARVCCDNCDTSYGNAKDRKKRQVLKRTLRSREKQQFQRELRNA
jgi:hypothetical protein